MNIFLLLLDGCLFCAVWCHVVGVDVKTSVVVDIKTSVVVVMIVVVRHWFDYLPTVECNICFCVIVIVICMLWLVVEWWVNDVISIVVVVVTVTPSIFLYHPIDTLWQQSILLLLLLWEEWAYLLSL